MASLKNALKKGNRLKTSVAVITSWALITGGYAKKNDRDFENVARGQFETVRDLPGDAIGIAVDIGVAIVEFLQDIGDDEDTSDLEARDGEGPILYLKRIKGITESEATNCFNKNAATLGSIAVIAGQTPKPLVDLEC